MEGQVMGKNSPGSFEQLVLMALVRLRDNAYGVTIMEELEARTGKEPSVGAVYTTLERLERKGYVKPRIGEPTPERGGRAKKYFTITAAGRKAMEGAVKDVFALLPGNLLPEGKR
jgi:PadR family transcriptional regulator, regulatory protein PadR